jgi:hypothetical protein
MERFLFVANVCLAQPRKRQQAKHSESYRPGFCQTPMAFVKEVFGLTGVLPVASRALDTYISNYSWIGSPEGRGLALINVRSCSDGTTSCETLDLWSQSPYRSHVNQTRFCFGYRIGSRQVIVGVLMETVHGR